jgi:hypothetical protein
LPLFILGINIPRSGSNEKNHRGLHLRLLIRRKIAEAKTSGFRVQYFKKKKEKKNIAV